MIAVEAIAQTRRMVAQPAVGAVHVAPVGDKEECKCNQAAHVRDTGGGYTAVSVNACLKRGRQVH